MKALLLPRTVHEVLARIERGPQPLGMDRLDDLVRLVLHLPPEDLTFLARHTPQRMSWLLLYHPETPRDLVPWALAGLPWQDVLARYEFRVSVDPSLIESVPADVRPLVVGRLMLAALNGQVPVTAVPTGERLYQCLDGWLDYGALPYRLAMWEALYTLAEGVQLWRETGWHPRQWEYQTIMASMPSADSAELLAFAAAMWRWADDDSNRGWFVGLWWDLTLKYLRREDGETMGFADLCRFIRAAQALRPPFMARTQPDRPALDDLLVDDFDVLFRAVVT